MRGLGYRVTLASENSLSQSREHGQDMTCQDAPGAPSWAGEKLELTVLEGRFRDACFCCARSNDVASERSFPPLAKGGPGAVGRERWKSKTTPRASREGCFRTKVRGHERV